MSTDVTMFAAVTLRYADVDSEATRFYTEMLFLCSFRAIC